MKKIQIKATFEGAAQELDVFGLEGDPLNELRARIGEIATHGGKPEPEFLKNKLLGSYEVLAQEKSDGKLKTATSPYFRHDRLVFWC